MHMLCQHVIKLGSITGTMRCVTLSRADSLAGNSCVHEQLWLRVHKKPRAFGEIDRTHSRDPPCFLLVCSRGGCGLVEVHCTIANNNEHQDQDFLIATLYKYNPVNQLRECCEHRTLESIHARSCRKQHTHNVSGWPTKPPPRTTTQRKTLSA